MMTKYYRVRSQEQWGWLTFTASVEATGVGMQVYSIKK